MANHDVWHDPAAEIFILCAIYGVKVPVCSGVGSARARRNILERLFGPWRNNETRKFIEAVINRPDLLDYVPPREHPRFCCSPLVHSANNKRWKRVIMLLRVGADPCIGPHGITLADVAFRRFEHQQWPEDMSKREVCEWLARCHPQACEKARAKHYQPFKTCIDAARAAATIIMGIWRFRRDASAITKALAASSKDVACLIAFPVARTHPWDWEERATGNVRGGDIESGGGGELSLVTEQKKIKV